MNSNKPYRSDPVIMAQSYNMARAYPQYWHPDKNPTVPFVPTGTRSAQNNRSDHWSQGPNGYPGMPPAGLGNTYNPNDPYVVRYGDLTTEARKTQAESYPIHYKGPVPPQNYDATLTLAAQLAPLRDAYLAQWLESVSPEVAAQMLFYNVSRWNYERNDTTPLYRTGSRYSQ